MVFAMQRGKGEQRPRLSERVWKPVYQFQYRSDLEIRGGRSDAPPAYLRTRSNPTKRSRLNLKTKGLAGAQEEDI